MKHIKRTMIFIGMMILFCLSSVTTDAQTYKYQTTSFAYKTYDYQWKRWTEWSDWENSSMLVVISLDREVISIYSQSIQEYDIVEYQGEERDSDGGESVKFLCVNEDGLRCNIRLRTQRDGQRQLYVDFSDMMWVYSIVDR